MRSLDSHCWSLSALADLIDVFLSYVLTFSIKDVWFSSYYMYAVFKVHIWLIFYQSLEISNAFHLKPLITGKTSYHNSTSLLIGLTPAHRSSPSTVLFPTELTCQRLFLYEQAPSLFFSLIRRPPALPHRLQCSTIGRLRLNRRVRDGNGCFPQAHRHRKHYLLGEVFSSLVNKLVLRSRTTSFSLITQQ